MKSAIPSMGAVIVTYNSSDVIRECLETLMAAAEGVTLSVVVVDNASPDKTIDVINAWADGEDDYILPENLPFTTKQVSKPVPRRSGETGESFLHVIKNEANSGFAAGVNLGLSYLVQSPEIDRFWVLNPDCVVPPGTPITLATHPVPPSDFAIMGGRVSFFSPYGRIQGDGGRINRLTGVTTSVNRGLSDGITPPPLAETLDFILGASMVASRTFLEQAGPVPEDYFLYYEEVDWALRRGALPLLYCDCAPVYHHAGSAIGSGNLERAATDFSVYFLYRARMRFMRRYYPWSLPVTYLYAMAKAGQLGLRGQRAQLYALLRAINGLPPPSAVRTLLSPATQNILGVAGHKKLLKAD